MKFNGFEVYFPETISSDRFFSQINMQKQGYNFEIFRSGVDESFLVSDPYISYGDCVSAMQQQLILEQINDSCYPEILLDFPSFDVIQINYNLRKLLAVPYRWNPFRLFSKNQESQIKDRILIEKKYSEFLEIQSYVNALINAQVTFMAIALNDRIFLRLILNPVLGGADNTEKLIP